MILPDLNRQTTLAPLFALTPTPEPATAISVAELQQIDKYERDSDWSEGK